MQITRQIQRDKDKIAYLLSKDKLTDDELHELNRLYDDLYFYLEHLQKEKESD